jgi:cytochrome c nitrite reductase small subunit
MSVRWRWLMGIVGAVALVLLAGLFVYPLVATANDDVSFCLSCHVMKPMGESFATSYHRQRTEVTCSSCHVGSLVQKYTDGARHFWANLTGEYPDPIRIREESRQVVAANCAECHNPTSLHARTKQQKGQNCLDCHRGHDPRAVHVNGFGQ